MNGVNAPEMFNTASAASALINLVTSAIPAAAMPQLDRSMEVNVFETAATFPNAMMPERSRSYSI